MIDFFDYENTAFLLNHSNSLVMSRYEVIHLVHMPLKGGWEGGLSNSIHLHTGG